VDAVGLRIDSARKRPPKAYKPKLPNEAVDGCERSHEAADGKKQKTSMDSFDDTGLMALVCRHDIPLFFANIDTPGEQQKYAVALIEHLFTFLPHNATVANLYDIGCVLDRSLNLVSAITEPRLVVADFNKYDILAHEIMERLMFATSAMHAYGHEWSCQLIYNPRLREGLGLTDGEGVERLWSRLRKLIGITRASGVSARHVSFVFGLD
jgi:Kyakuja-Dileera-Zisupton transposase